jgi:hypothetical protein
VGRQMKGRRVTGLWPEYDRRAVESAANSPVICRRREYR